MSEDFEYEPPIKNVDKIKSPSLRKGAERLNARHRAETAYKMKINEYRLKKYGPDYKKIFKQ